MTVYLDNAATTPILPKVASEMMDVMAQNYGNPSSIHQEGRRAKHQLMMARRSIADSIGADEDEILFTSSGSEGDNMALVEGALANQDKGHHIISTQVEHPAVLETLYRLENMGFDVTYLPVNDKGEITLKQVQEAFKPGETILVSIMFGNNEVGTLYPIQEIGEWLRDKDTLFHTDAVQAYGTEMIDVNTLPVDLLTVAAHKVNGPRGIGFLYIRKGTHIQPLITGGEQENHRRAGTENLPAIVGFASAVQYLNEEEKQQRHERYQQFRNHIISILDEEKIEYHINGSHQHLPHILNLWIHDVPSDLLLMQLDLQGFAVSTGSACTAGNVDPSHVLQAMYGSDSPAVTQSVRISFGYQNTMEEIQKFSQTLVRSIKQLKGRRK